MLHLQGKVLDKKHIHWPHIAYATFDDPVNQRYFHKLHTQLFPVRLLAVKRDTVYIRLNYCY